jgi:hypothetical protein
MKRLSLLIAILVQLTAMQAAEVTDGFKTIGEGVTVLKAGDTLTIMPGEYRGQISAALAGTAEAPPRNGGWMACAVCSAPLRRNLSTGPNRYH